MSPGLSLDALHRLLASGAFSAVATVVRTWHSAPRPVGARLLYGPGPTVKGSVSGGCVEADVMEAAVRVAADQRPRLLHYGVADEKAWSVGLACGGEMEVWVEPVSAWRPLVDLLGAAAASRNAVCIATVLDPAHPGKLAVTAQAATGPAPSDQAPDEQLAPPELAAAMSKALHDRRSALTALEADGGRRVFLDVVVPSPRLLIVGAVHIAQALVPIARVLGFECWVIDPRAELATEARFPEAHRIVCEWPDSALRDIGLDADCCVVTLSHDAKLDVPALAAAAASPARYLGALGSRRTQEKLRQRLADLGVPPEQLARIRGPVGLDIGARTPEEIALAIAAEIVSVQRAAHSTHRPHTSRPGCAQ